MQLTSHVPSTDEKLTWRVLFLFVKGWAEISVQDTCKDVNLIFINQLHTEISMRILHTVL